MTRILICDDNIEDLKAIAKTVTDFYNRESGILPAQCALSCFSDSKTALSYFEDNSILDIVMLGDMTAEMKGHNIASEFRALGFRGHLVFMTAKNDFTAQSYAVNAFSCILKPIRQETLFDLLVAIEEDRKTNDRNGFILNRKVGTRLVLFSELKYVEVIDHHLSFHLANGDIVKMYASLKDYSDMLLSRQHMIKAQKSFIINLDYVRSCEKNTVIMRDGKCISVLKMQSIVPFIMFFAF